MHASKGLRALCLLLLLAPAAPPAHSQAAGQSPNATRPPAAAARPSLAGTWIPKGEHETMPNAGPEGWTKVNVGQREDAVKFSVVHAADSKSQNYELTYYADGRGETNRGMVYFFITANSKLAAEEVKSKSAWDGRALV